MGRGVTVSVTLDARPGEGEVNDLFQFLRARLQADGSPRFPLAQRFSLLALDDGGFRVRMPLFSAHAFLDARLVVRAKDGTLQARVAGVGHLPAPELSVLERVLDRRAEGIDFQRCDLSRDPRRIAIALTASETDHRTG